MMPLLDSGNPRLFAVAMIGVHALAALGIGPASAFLPELFATRYRYTATALAINLAGVVGGAVPPLIAGTLVALYGSWAIGFMLALLLGISLVCLSFLPETSQRAL